MLLIMHRANIMKNIIVPAMTIDIQLPVYSQYFLLQNAKRTSGESGRTIVSVSAWCLGGRDFVNAANKRHEVVRIILSAPAERLHNDVLELDGDA